jgi:L,D-transpeptidase ErfK/SrfK
MRSQIAILATLLVALVVSLYAVAYMGARKDSMEEDYARRMAELADIRAQRDTLEAVNAMLLAQSDSMTLLRRRADSLDARLLDMELRDTYPGYHLTIDTYQNRFHLWLGNMLVRSGYCGTGKGWETNEQGLTWDFSTPRGIRYVEEKGTNPYWYRPDWYWQEQNLRPPSEAEVVVIPEELSYGDQISYYRDSLTASERVYVRAVPGVLGSYKIDLGGGILLHYGVGRGRNVSHGCIRLSGDDLEALYRTLPIGAPVIIY